MHETSAELWLPATGDGLPECLLGVALLSVPMGDSFYRLTTNSIWTPLTWGDSVRTRPHPDGGHTVTALAAAGPHVRTTVSHSVGLSPMEARTTAYSWFQCGALVTESAPGSFVTAWSPELDESDVRGLLASSIGSDGRWSILELWTPEERTPDAIAEHLPS